MRRRSVLVGIAVLADELAKTRAAVRPDDRDVHRRFGAATLPDTYVVDASGRLVQRIAGSRNWQLRAARAYLTSTLTR